MKQTFLYELEQGDTIALAGLRGLELKVAKGQLWITEASYAHDAFIAACSTYQVQGDAAVLIQAMAPSALTVPVQPRGRTWWQSMTAFARSRQANGQLGASTNSNF
jgi:Protein of unknown function (DUF2917)